MCAPLSGFNLPTLAVPTATTISTTAATTTATTITAATTAESAAARPVLFRTCFVHAHWTAHEVLAVEFGNSLIGLILRPHLNKRETTRFVGDTINDELATYYRTDLGEQLLQLTLNHIERQITNIQLRTHT